MSRLAFLEVPDNKRLIKNAFCCIININTSLFLRFLSKLLGFERLKAWLNEILFVTLQPQKA
jgi:hypothetical protein